MKIATYNVWNQRENMDLRRVQLIEEINGIDADIVGLQEVSPDFWEELLPAMNYPHHAFFTYQEEDEGLAFLSKHPIEKTFFLNQSAEHHNSLALNVLLEVNGMKLSVTNVHLPWDSALEKEKQMVAVDRFIHGQKEEADFFILLGDFNGNLSSSVHRFLLGDQSLLGCEAKPYWNHPAGVHAALNGYEVIPTLDFVGNPRWGGKNTNEIPAAFDRIYVMECYNWDNSFKVHTVKVFGREVSEVTGLSPSDHYGVAEEIEFSVV